MSGFDDDDVEDIYIDDNATDSEEIPPLQLPQDDSDSDEEESLTPEQVAAAIERARLRSLEPRPFVLKESKKRVAIVDTETDPFAPGFLVKPFALGFYDGERYLDWWGDDCVKEFFDYLATCDEEYIIYAHNGGKFDFFFFLQHMSEDQSPLIMGGRLVKIFFGGQEFRDSYSIIPQALSAYKKDEIDYNNFTRDKRERHKAAILAYQKTDCIYAYELIIGFHQMFGDKVTIASAALPMLNSVHGFQRIRSDAIDEKFRRYFYGGRNQCFETGELTPNPGQQFMMIDRNSMYPAVMRDELHPISNTFRLQTSIDDDTDFACIDARNDGALPVRSPDGAGLDFTQKSGTFYATIHEIRAGIETGTLTINRVRHAWAFERKSTFAEYVNRFYALRQEAKAAGDKVRDILYKFVLNSAYGKFALNPRRFKQYCMTIDELPQPQATPDNPNGWAPVSQAGSIMIWSRPSPRKNGFYNVATAASITGAARANLLRNLALADRPIYCDTDSILCEGFRGNLDEVNLGGWKLEATGDRAAIAGKKLYALFNQADVLKKASKGVRLEALDILRVCNGEEIVYENPVPNFKLDGSAEFVTRRINRTGII